MAAVLILGLGLAELVYFEPPGQHTGTTAHVQGIYRYDPATGSTGTRSSREFTVDDHFAAVVDWASLPSSMEVAARWYNALDVVVGAAGPAPAANLVGEPVVPVRVPPGLSRNLPGEYVFVVERYSGGQPVELLARRLILVKRA